jgi:hypothetical protein
MIVRRAIAAVLLVLLPAAAHGGFLAIEEGARATAMGGAFTAVSDDATAVFWNPAGLGLMDGLSLTGMGTRLFSVDGLSESVVSLTYADWKKTGIGAGWARTGVEDVYNENTFVVSAGRQVFRDGLSVGGTFRIYRLAAPGYEYYNDPNFSDGAQDYAVDLGVLYRARTWSAGLTLRNLGQPEMSLISTTEEKDPVSSEVRVGGSYIFREVMLISGEVRIPNEVPGYYTRSVRYALGTEIWFVGVFALRAGINDGKATAGLGLKINWLTIDASLLSVRRPGTKYRLSLSLDF